MSQHNEQLTVAVRRMFDALKGKVDTLFNRTDTHIAREDNPHQVTKAQVGLDKIPNAITSLRTTDSVTMLLTAKGMHDHTNSGDHDGRYYTETEMDAALALKVDIAAIVNDLVSTTTDAPLSAAQGKELKDAIDAINALINSDDATLDEIQEIVDYIKVNRDALENLDIAAIAGLQTALDGKVDKVTGKALSANDFTDTLLTKLNGIESGAEVNVASNLSFTRGSSGYSIQNSFGTGVDLLAADAANYGMMTPGQVSKLNGIEVGAQVNRPTTSSRSLEDTGTVLTAKGMADHTNSGDHDERYYTQTQLNTSLDGKVDKVTGKGLSTEDYTSTEKIKLAGIQEGAQVNVGTNLGMGGSGNNRSVTSSTGSNVVLPVASSTTAGLMTTAQFDKLGGIEAGAEVNVATNLGLTLTGTAVTITNSNGSNVEIPAASTTDAGAMTQADRVKLNGIEAGAQVNVGTNLSLTGTGDTRTLQSSTGNNVALPVATDTNAGLMGVNDRSKLSGIESGAQVNIATNLSIGGTADAPILVSSTGDNVSFPLASTTIAGLLAAADKTKLNSVAANAEPNQPTTASRTSSATETVLQAKAMADHVASADHDGRYVGKAGGDTIDGDLTLTGDLTCNDVVMTSDPRLKDDMESMGSTLQRYLQLSPFSYRLKDDESGQIHYGFLTTDVKGLFPNIVRTREDGYEALSYNSFHAIAQSAIKQLADELDIANDRIGSLEEDVQELKDLVAKLTSAN